MNDISDDKKSTLNTIDWPKTFTPTSFPFPDYNNPINPQIITDLPSSKEWALTFDDGPSLYTPRLLAFLKKHNIKATFFVIGPQVLEFPETLKQIVDDGHLIGLHGWGHQHSTEISPELFMIDLQWAIKAIHSVLGIIPKYYRPPYGEYSTLTHSIVSKCGFITVMWTKYFDTNDWKITDELGIGTFISNAKNWIKKDREGGVVSLEHDLREMNVLLAERLIPLIQQYSGTRFVTVAQGMNDVFYQDIPYNSK